MARITRSPPKPKPKFVYEVHVGWTHARQPWLWEAVERIAGAKGYRKRKPSWSFTIVSFTLKAQADELALIVRRRRELDDRAEVRRHPCRYRVRYDEAADAQYAVIWGLSSGTIREVVKVYRQERRDCSTHGMPSWEAARPILAIAPTISHDKARKMVDAMLAYVIARHSTWFWSGLQGDQVINRY